jgi:hypothetical protein
VVPTFPHGVIPEIPKVHDETVYRLMCTAKMSVHMQICLVSQIASATVVLPDKYNEEHVRMEIGLDAVPSVALVVEQDVQLDRVRSLTAMADGSDTVNDAAP